MNLHLLHATPDLAEALQMGLRHRQDDLIDLETRLGASVETPLNTGSLTDSAEEVRRALRIHTTGQLDEIQSGLWEGRLLLSRFTGPPSDLRRGADYRVALTFEEASRASFALHRAAGALRPLTQTAPAYFEADRFREGIDTATGELEKARRAIFRLTEELPQLVREVDELAAPVPARRIDGRNEAPSMGLTHHRAGIPTGPREGGHSPDPGT